MFQNCCMVNTMLPKSATTLKAYVGLAVDIRVRVSDRMASSFVYKRFRVVSVIALWLLFGSISNISQT
jgi:hypothetical protein